jgi:WhiB family redox-sensing transcriptional regulator
MFFPDEHAGGRRQLHEHAAKHICRQCPVINECRDHALRTPELHGIWGAMTAHERSRVRTVRPPAGHG